MKKITFKNLPDKTIPISANNLNQLQNNVEEAILNPVVESIKSKNLVNEIVTGYTLTGSGGIKVEAIQFVTGFMEVEEGKTYTSQGFKGANGVENNYKDWYTADKTFISNTNDKTATAPANAKFCRMNGVISTSSNMQLEEGNTATSYTPFKRYGYNNKESMGSIVVDDIRSKNFFDVNKITSTTVNGVTISKNANGGLVLNGTATGQIDFFYVELVSESKIKPGKTYTLSSNALPQDDKLQVFLQNSNSATWVSTIANIKGTINPDTFTVSTLPGTHFKFLILILEGATLNNFVLYPQIEEGSTATNYSEYKGIGYTSGSNENGSWVKYDDGRMECWGVKSYSNVAITNLDIHDYYAQLSAQPFPQTFKNKPVCIMSIDNVQPGYALILKSSGNGATTTTTPLTLAFCSISCNVTQLDVHYHAYGYWK